MTALGARLRALRRATRPWRRRGRSARKRWDVLIELLDRHCPGEALAVAEVGVYQGHTTAHLHARCPRIERLFAIDVAAPDPSRDRIRDLERVEFVKGPSERCAQRFEDASLDLVFIDADHDEQAVRADLAAWVPKVRAGGIVAGHDYASPRHPGVKRAVDGWFADHAHPVRVEADRVWWTFR